jgi:uncharacterized protein YegJ (DUF2314 family)
VSVTKRDGEPEIYNAAADDKEMNAAVAAAKASFTEFDSAFRSNIYDSSTFFIKVRFPTAEGNEHIWAMNLTIDHGIYYGVVDNLPNLVTDVRVGEKVRIDTADISDWMFSDNGMLRGGYTIRVIRDRMTSADKAAFDSSFPFRIDINRH